MSIASFPRVILHLCSYLFQQALRPKIAELFRLAKQAGLTTSPDTNDDLEDRWDLDLVWVLKSVDVLLPKEAEACRLTRCDDAENRVTRSRRICSPGCNEAGREGRGRALRA